MRTLWIIKTLKGEVFITENHPEYYKNAIGPFWTYKEAMQCLYKWTKLSG